MFTEIEQGLEIYRQNLAEYSSLVEKLKIDEPDFSVWTSDRAVVERVVSWNARLEGMADALGLDEEEKGNFFAQVGINYKPKELKVVDEPKELLIND